MLYNEADPAGGSTTPTPTPDLAATPDPWSADELAAAKAWAQQYYTSHAIPSTYGTADDLVNNYMAQRRNGVAHQAAMDTVPGILGWDKYTATPKDSPPSTTAPPPAAGGGGGAPPPGAGGGSIYTFPGSFTAPTPTTMPTMPTFTPPGYTPPPAFSYADYTPGEGFKAPSPADALNDPGYQFRFGQGQDALQNWSAARGTLNDSSTAKALIDYGQAAGSQEYSNVWDRSFRGWGANEANRFNTYATNRANAVGNYNTNYQTQYEDPFKNSYQSYLDTTLNPAMHGFDTASAATMHANDNNYLNAWNSYINAQNQFYGGLDRRREDLKWTATA